MSLIIYNSEFYYSKYPYQLDEFIKNSIEQENLSNSIIIVPTGKWQRRLKNQIIREYFKITGKPCGEPKVYNLQKFASIVMQKFPKVRVTVYYLMLTDLFFLKKL
jgi:hypothetical protein